MEKIMFKKVVYPPSRGRVNQKIQAKRWVMYQDRLMIEDVEWSYEVELHPILGIPTEVRAKTYGMPGACRSRWEPCEGGWGKREVPKKILILLGLSS